MVPPPSNVDRRARREINLAIHVGTQLVDGWTLTDGFGESVGLSRGNARNGLNGVDDALIISASLGGIGHSGGRPSPIDAKPYVVNGGARELGIALKSVRRKRWAQGTSASVSKLGQGGRTERRGVSHVDSGGGDWAVDQAKVPVELLVDLDGVEIAQVGESEPDAEVEF